MRKRNSFSILVSWFVLLAGGSVLTAGNACGQQQQAIIRVTDEKSNEPVAFANVCFEGLKHQSKSYGLTSINGTVPNQVKEPSTMVISYVGFVSFTDTINPGESLEIKLKPSILNMNEVVVTAQYTPEKADKSIYRIAVINSRQIESKAAVNLGDLLKDETTMRVEQNGVLGSSLRIQGMSGENIKFLVDGTPLIGRMNGNFDLNQISLNNIDHVEVIEGPMSVIYGSNALAGVINLITKENKSSFSSVSANTYYESVGQYNFYASATLNPKRHGIFLDGGRNFFGGYDGTRTASEQVDVLSEFKPRRQYFMDGYYTYTTSKVKLKFSGDYFNELILDRGPLLGLYRETVMTNYYNTVRYSGRSDLSWQLPRKHFITAVVSYSTYERTKKSYTTDLTTLTRIENTTPDSRDTSGIYAWVGRVVFSKNNPEKKFNYQTGIDINTELGTGKRITGNKQAIGDYAAFLSLKWDPWKHISLQPGVRIIYNTKYNAPLVYALSARWEVLNNFNIRVSYARGFRAPELKQLYLNFIDISHHIEGNPDLKAERSHNFNLNLNYGLGKNSATWTFDATGFYNIIENVILLANTGEGATFYKYVNLDYYQTTGFQATAGVNLYPSIRFQLGWAETGIFGSAGDAGKLKDFIFSNDLTATLSYRFIKPELTFDFYYKYSGKAPTFIIEDEVPRVQYMNPYHTLDFTATKGFWVNRIRLSAGLKNIMDNKSIPISGAVGGAHSGGTNSADVGWGRTFFVRLSFSFNTYK